MKRKFGFLVSILALVTACLSSVAAQATTSSTSVVENLSVEMTSPTTVALSWTAPAWSPELVTDYRVEYKQSSETQWTSFSHSPSSQTQITVSGLIPGTAYNFRVSPSVADNVQSSRTWGIKQVAVGMNHACALTDIGEIFCWGDNTYGQLGNSDLSLTSSAVPLKVGNFVATSITSGRDHVCALTSSGAIKCWGSNTNGQLGTGDSSYDRTAQPQNVSGITTATSIGAGAMHTCAVVDNGVGKCWGAGAKYRLGAASSFAQNDLNAPTAVVGLTGVMVNQIVAGTSQSCALLASKAVRCWGDNANGQLGSGANSSATPSPKPVVGIDGVTSSAVQISMGSQHACAVLTDGTVKCWGVGASGRLGNGAVTNSATPVSVKMGNATLTGVRSIAAGFESSCATLNSASVVCWGNNASGQLGNGNLLSQSQAVDTGITNGISVAADYGSNVSGVGHNCAVTSDSSVKCWGSGANFVLGNGTSTSSSTPTTALISGPLTVTPVGVPDPPTWTGITPVLRGLQLAWQIPASNGLPISELKVTFVGGDHDGQTACNLSATDTGCEVLGLASGTNYQFALAASNSKGSSTASLSDAVQTKTSGTFGDLTWTNSNNQMTISGCAVSCMNIAIPSAIDGDPVTEIASDAFATQVLSTLSLPNTVVALNANSFGANKLPLTRLNSFQPQISGTGSVGSLLTVSNSAWLTSSTKSYTWLRDGQVILGATLPRYTPTSADYGKAIAVRVTLAKVGYVSTSIAGNSVTISAGNNPISPKPAISGITRVGQTISVKSGAWSPGTILRYQWLRDGLAISGASDQVYQIGVADLGKRISVAVTGSRYGYLDKVQSSASYSVLPGVQNPITNLSIEGVGQTGQILSVNTSYTGLVFQWLRNSSPIVGATSSTYLLGSADVGRIISLRVTRKQPGYLDAVVLLRFGSLIKK
ncbi:MAG: fibronectin type III domain-containing protein [Actinomycetales bacterium]|nr:fibronectin type III domain-containing protein [Actinomycetales bacterium]